MLLAQLASEEVSLLAFSAVPFGPDHVELTIFPDQADTFLHLAKKLGWEVAGPQHAVLVQGDERLISRFTPLAASPMAAGDLDM